MPRPDYITCITKEGKLSFCGRNISMEFAFVDLDHATASSGGRLEVCSACARKAIDSEYEKFFREVEGKITVGHWSGHGEGGTYVQVSLNETPDGWRYELPEGLKRWIGQGRKVKIMLISEEGK